MCLYPRLIKNKRFLMYNEKKPQKGKSTAIKCEDERKLFVAVGCGKCIECKKQKAREWQIRLQEELPIWKYKYFMTFTFSCDNLKTLTDKLNGTETNVNKAAQIAVRRFLERWRKKYKRSVTHWLITELGHEGTERIHLHGIIFDNEPHTNEEFEEIWKYGWTYTGDYCTERTINYIIKYVTKIDPDHKTYEPDIYCSAGLGANYFKKQAIRDKHAWNGKNTIQYYTLKNGQKVSLPKYYRNKLFTQEQRDQLWTDLLDSDRTYVRGIRCDKISTAEGYANYIKILAEQQRDNIAMGYGDTTWKEQIYRTNFQMINGKFTFN